MTCLNLVTRRAIRVSLSLTLLTGCAWPHAHARRNTAAAREWIVALSAVADSAPAQWYGMSNIFRDSIQGPARDSVRMPTSWTGAALDDVVRNSALRPIRVVRFHLSGEDTPRFAIDTVGDLDFTRAPVLTFARQGRMLVANIALTVRSVAGAQRRVPYQILRSDDGYTYARIAEYRTGQLEVGGKTYALKVRNSSRGRPFHDTNAGSVFLVDLNADGQFAEAVSLTLDGRPVAAEQILASTPFELDDRFYEITAIDSAGTLIHIRPSNQTVAVSLNRRAPDLRATPVAGGVFRLSEQMGKVVLISFWATDCIFSERARIAANAIVAKYGSKFTWVAMAKDTNRADIAAYLKASPIDGIATLPESDAWRTYNPAGMTPLFILVDTHGVVRFRAEGASAIGVVAAKVDELMSAANR